MADVDKPEDEEVKGEGTGDTPGETATASATPAPAAKKAAVKKKAAARKKAAPKKKATTKKKAAAKKKVTPKKKAAATPTTSASSGSAEPARPAAAEEPDIQVATSKPRGKLWAAVALWGPLLIIWLLVLIASSPDEPVAGDMEDGAAAESAH